MQPRNSPDEPKFLSPREDAPDAELHSFTEVSDAAEANEIASRIGRLVEDGVSPGSCAVLIRRWSQAAPVLDALSDAGIPCEVAESGDLLARPEVTLVSDYLRLVARPARSRDALLRLLTRNPLLLSASDLRAVFGTPGGTRRALEDPGSFQNLSDEARERLAKLRSTLDRLEAELAAAVSLGEFVERAVEVVGVGRELRSTPTAGARLGLQFLGIFCDVAREFGEVGSIEEFIRYLEIMGESTATERASPPTEHADAVRVMTVHRAKGLEFDHLFVPGLSQGIFPYNRATESALEKAEAIPPPLELDPDPESRAAYETMDADAMKEALKREAEEEEGRLFYVAATRARESLTLSRAHFYLRNKRAKKPGRFWELLGDSPEEVHISRSAEPEVPQSNPNLETGAEQENGPADRWPLEAAAPGDDAEIAGNLGVEGWEEELREVRRDIVNIPERRREKHLLPAPETHSPSSLMAFEVCPRRYYYEQMFPVPSVGGGLEDAREYGSEMHAWIEGGMKDAPPEPEGGGNVSAGRAPTDFRDTEYGRRAAEYPIFKDAEPPNSGPARMAEVPFALALDGAEVRGRVDAVFVDEDGAFHVVDWKTGRPRHSYAERLQLPLYALAANRLWGVEPERMRLAYVFVPGGDLVELDTGGDFLERAERRTLDALQSIRRRNFEPTPSRYACSHCPVMGVGIPGCPTEVPEE